jgi:hypothetical protein
MADNPPSHFKIRLETQPVGQFLADRLGDGRQFGKALQADPARRPEIPIAPTAFPR